MPPIAAYEVASFYNMYDLQPVGKYKITVCTNLPCALSGGYHAGEYLQKKLGVGYGETTPDGKFTLKEGECMGACGDAPVFIINNRSMCSHMHPEQIDKLLIGQAAGFGGASAGCISGVKAVDVDQYASLGLLDHKRLILGHLREGVPHQCAVPLAKFL